MRVYVEHDMTVNHNTSVVTLRAGQIVEGPLAVYLVESDCNVTIEQDDRLAAEAAPVTEEGSHVPSGGTEPTGETAAAPEAPETSEEPAPAAEPASEPAADVPAEPGA